MNATKPKGKTKRLGSRQYAYMVGGCAYVIQNVISSEFSNRVLWSVRRLEQPANWFDVGITLTEAKLWADIDYENRQSEGIPLINLEF